MTWSLCSTLGAFCLVEFVLSMAALYLILWSPSERCMAIGHDAALRMCGRLDGVNESELSARRLAHGLFASPHEDVQSIVARRLESLESVTCETLNPMDFSLAAGPRHSVFFLAYFFVVNALLSVALFFRHRVGPMGTLFYFMQFILITVLAAVVLGIALDFQRHEQQSFQEGRGLTFHLPANWLSAVRVALGALLWKLVQIVFHAICGEKKIAVEHPVFKIFDFSKNYGTEADQSTA